jgi:hypothetical protein
VPAPSGRALSGHGASLMKLAEDAITLGFVVAAWALALYLVAW